MGDDLQDGGASRRGTLRLIVGAGSAAFACALAAPAAVFVAAPTGDEPGAGRQRWIKTVRLQSLVEAEPKKVSVIADQRDAWTLTKDVELGAVWLVRRGWNVHAWSATCPHLGCAIGAESNGAGFNCPCHTSGFDKDGRRLDGPSPRDMDVLETRVEGGVVLVDFRRFRLATPDRIEVG
jgi:cytochrome b6-f complex iron-sulfur subunit/menaquinol-cytochrome c reductase iron-sulfur subunit